MNTLVLIPAYNEAATLADVARAALIHADSVLVVDDGCTDGTIETLEALRVHVLAHQRNEGKSASLVDGFAWAIALGATQVITMDADGQHRASDIPRLLRAATVHPRALIIGARMRVAGAAPRARRAANRFADFWVSWASGHCVRDSQSGQRVYPVSLLRELDLGLLARDGFTLESQLIIIAARMGYATVSVPIDAIYKPGSRPSYFRPVPHIAAIVRMIARSLLQDKLKLRGLWTSLREPAAVFSDQPETTPNRDDAMGLQGARGN